ncbi:hypothetical protein ACFSLT_26930 [Novosphingobium resinovorum]
METVAGYLQGDYEVVPDLTVTVGARYTYEKKSIDYFDSERFPGFGFNSADVRAAGIPLKLTQNRVTRASRSTTSSRPRSCSMLRRRTASSRAAGTATPPSRPACWRSSRK